MFGLMGVARLSGQPGGAWSPLRLFAASEQGAWYDPSDFASMFQDSAGTTPVTAVEQPVGLILDKRLGLVLGPELVPHPSWTGGYTVNGARQTPLAWNEYNGANISASTVTPNSYQFTATASLAGIELPSYSSGIALGDFISCTVRARKTAFVSGTPSLQLYTGVWHEIVPVSASIGDWYEKTVRVAFTNPAIILSNFNGAASWEVEFISAKKLPGNHATQPTAAARPILRQDGGGKYYLETDGIDDRLVTSAIDLTGTSATTVFAGAYKANDTNVMAIVDFPTATGAATAGGLSLWAGDPQTGGAAKWAASMQSTGGGGADDAISGASYAAPATGVLTYLAEIAGQRTVRVNGAVDGNSPFALTAGTFGNHALALSRVGVNGLAGRIYGVVLLGRAATANEITATEAYIASKSGVTL